MDALKTAVSAFIDEIHHNDLYEDDTYDKPRDTPLGNQISIVKFATNYYGNTASITPGNHFTNLNGTNQGDESTNSHEYNCTEVRIGFTTTATEANVNSLKTAVNSLTATGATAADYGMNLAHLLINSLGEARVNTSKTVVFFTDGEPNHNSGFSTSVATSAISYSKQIKAITYGEGDDATHPSVYSVGVFDSTPPSGGNLDNFMNYISSNYPDATAYNSGGTKASSDYYMDASSGSAEDLKKIFTSIAHAAGGSGTTEVTSESAVTVDVVSTSFSVPTGGSAVQVLVAPCNGKTTIDGKEYLTFGEEKIPSEYDLDAITAKIDVAENKVSTSGFDFSTNWCGPDPTSTSAIHNYAYHGFKQIIRFVITVNDAAVGGPSVATNSAESGIYLDGSDTPLVTFNRPTVKLPVQIWIQKTGLVGEDSAVFTLYATPYVEGQEASVYMSDDYKKKWISFTKVIVNSGNMEEIDDPNNPGTKIKVKKLVGLDPDYFYKLKEDAWAFGYQYQDGDGIVYTVGEVTNPIKIENTPKEIHFDEDVVRNVFKEK